MTLKPSYSGSDHAFAFVVGLALHLLTIRYAWHIAGLVAPLPVMNVWQLWGLSALLVLAVVPNLTRSDDDGEVHPLLATMVIKGVRIVFIAIIHAIVWLVTN